MNTLAFAASPQPEPVILPALTKESTRNSIDVAPYGGISEATEEDIQKWADVEKPALNKNATAEPSAVSREVLSPFTYIPQEESYTCGPASGRMALYYINGSAPSEEDVADGCNTTPTNGTKMSDLAHYLNLEQDYNYYVAKYGQSKTSMKNDLYSGVSYYDAPPLVGLLETTTDGWPYDLLDGHCIAIYGALSDKSEFALCDPWAGFRGDDYWRWYQMTADQIYNAHYLTSIGYIF